LEAWGQEFPSLTEVYSIGETLRGNPLMVIEITNEETGPAAEKPGYYYDGNIHAGELTGGEVALHFASYLLTNYGRNERVTRLIDSRALYIRPKFNPDGADLALTSAQTLRSTPRPYDQDMDGLLDEDPPNDLDGDGHITQMRVPNPDGDWYVSPDDPRLMVRRPGSGGRRGAAAQSAPPPGAQFYDVMSEGIDDDHDGRRNEDGVGGIDMNRNFPRNWGMEFEQGGAGPYPLSEPETRATIEFLNSHRNITGIFHGHTSGGFVYRLPSTTAWNNFSAADQELILEEAAVYEQTTEQPAVPSYTNPEAHRHGTLISWGYWDFGVVGFVPEFWAGMGIDYDEDGEISALERLRYHDEELTRSYFTDWAPYDHPELGAVEIGGWHSKFVSQNPPTELLQREVELYVPWMLWLAEIAPQIEIRDVTVTPVDGQAGTFRVRVEVENSGYLPTNLTQRALDAEVAVPVRAIAELTGAEWVEGNGRVEIGHLRGSRDGGGPGAPTSSTGSAEFLVRATGADPAIELAVVSERGGTRRRTVALR
ncbi:MAG: M14 family metallopeptidase, partial [Acidobacteriota bacterium]